MNADLVLNAPSPIGAAVPPVMVVELKCQIPGSGGPISATG